MGYGIVGILLGMALLIPGLTEGSAGSIIPGLIFLLMGIYVICVEISREKLAQSEMKNSSIDRSENIIDKIGGVNNIDINLSKYCDRNQLIVLKDKSIHIGYNNYETQKIINFDSIINVDIRINNVKKESLAGYTNYHKDLIESIFVYIHTNECTEEIIFRYSSYETNEIQEKYNEILKGLKRFKSMLGDTLDADGLDNEINLNHKEKSIPEQIKEYKDLLDVGAITKEEYEALKKNLLSELRA